MRPALAAAFAALSVTGCASTTSPPDASFALAPADPSVGLANVQYHPVTGGYRHREPVDPQDWRRQNRNLSPAQEQTPPPAAPDSESPASQGAGS